VVTKFDSIFVYWIRWKWVVPTKNQPQPGRSVGCEEDALLFSKGGCNINAGGLYACTIYDSADVCVKRESSILV
jgi:hypothetical protein